ncbi:MAG: hypothetical protein ACOC4S_00350, partial [Balneolaceae bacterium]
MDRNTLTGLILILIIMFAWAYFTMPSEEELRERQAEQARQDSIAAAQADSQEQDTLSDEPQRDDTTAQQEELESAPAIRGEEDRSEAPAMGVFSEASTSDTTQLVVQTPLFNIDFTNVGGGPRQITLKEHTTWDGNPVRMIADTSRSSYMAGFLTTENY